MQDPSENLRRRRAREHSKEIYQEVNLKRNDFFQNFQQDSGHPETICHIQVSNNGKYFTTCSESMVRVWKLIPEVKLLQSINIPQNDDADSCQNVMACLSNDFSRLVVYERVDLCVMMYGLDFNVETQQDEFMNPMEVDIEDFYEKEYGEDYEHDDEETYDDIRFVNDGKMNEGKMLRFYINRDKIPFFLDMDLDHKTVTFGKCKKFEDKSIFKFGPRFIKHTDQLFAHLCEEENRNCKFAFPE